MLHLPLGIQAKVFWSSQRGWGEKETKPTTPQVCGRASCPSPSGSGGWAWLGDSRWQRSLWAVSPKVPHNHSVTPSALRLRGKHCMALPHILQLTEGAGSSPTGVLFPSTPGTLPGPSPPSSVLPKLYTGQHPPVCKVPGNLQTEPGGAKASVTFRASRPPPLFSIEIGKSEVFTSSRKASQSLKMRAQWS